MGVAIEIYRSRIGSHHNFTQGRMLMSRMKGKFWNQMLMMLSLLRRHLTEESGGEKKFGEMPAINRHKNLHCAYRLAHANFDKLKLRGGRKGLRQGVKTFLFSTRWLKRRVKL